MKYVLIFCTLIFVHDVQAQIPVSLVVSPLYTYEEVYEQDIFVTLNLDYHPFDVSVNSESKRVYLVQVDTVVAWGEEDVYLQTKGYTLLSNPVNFFFAVVASLDVDFEQHIACPVKDKAAMLHHKYICNCDTRAKQKLVRSAKPKVWGGSPDGQLYFVCEKIDPS